MLGGQHGDRHLATLLQAFPDYRWHAVTRSERTLWEIEYLHKIIIFITCQLSSQSFKYLTGEKEAVKEGNLIRTSACC